MKKFVFLLLIIHCSIIIANAQWQPDMRLTNDPAGSFTSNNNARCVAAIGDFVHVVWSDYRDGIDNTEIYYKRSTNGGISWGTDIRLTNNPAYSGFPTVSVSGMIIHVVWYDGRDGNDEIYYKRSTDGGTSWGVDTRLTSNSSPSESPSMSVSSSTVHVVWFDSRDGNFEIYYKRSTDGGTSWGADTKLSNSHSYSDAPAISVYGQVVHVVWNDYRDGNMEIYYKNSTNGGTSWGEDTRLTNDPASSDNPCLSASGTYVHIVWDDDRDGFRNIYYKRSTDSGINWGADIRLTNNITTPQYPSILLSGLFVHAVWEDLRDGNFEIYYKRSTDGGVNWEADVRLTNNPAFSFRPSVAISGVVVHVVWEDFRDGSSGRIYYKRNPSGNVGIQNISSEIPSGFSLYQNYPNPFNPVTKIKFDIAQHTPYPLSRGENVTLKIYDITGREIQTLVKEKLNPGSYEVTFDGSNFVSGVYFYQLRTRDFIETKKLVLLK